MLGEFVAARYLLTTVCALEGLVVGVDDDDDDEDNDNNDNNDDHGKNDDDDDVGE